MVLKKDNVERVAEGEGAAFWKRKGYREVPENQEAPAKTGLGKMKLDELRIFAAGQGIEGVESYTKKDLLAVLEELGI